LPPRSSPPCLDMLQQMMTIHHDFAKHGRKRHPADGRGIRRQPRRAPDHRTDLKAASSSTQTTDFGSHTATCRGPARTRKCAKKASWQPPGGERKRRGARPGREKGPGTVPEGCRRMQALAGGASATALTGKVSRGVVERSGFFPGLKTVVPAPARTLYRAAGWARVDAGAGTSSRLRESRGASCSHLSPAWAASGTLEGPAQGGGGGRTAGARVRPWRFCASADAPRCLVPASPDPRGARGSAGWVSRPDERRSAFRAPRGPKPGIRGEFCPEFLLPGGVERRPACGKPRCCGEPNAGVRRSAAAASPPTPRFMLALRRGKLVAVRVVEGRWTTPRGRGSSTAGGAASMDDGLERERAFQPAGCRNRSWGRALRVHGAGYGSPWGGPALRPRDPPGALGATSRTKGGVRGPRRPRTGDKVLADRRHVRAS